MTERALPDAEVESSQGLLRAGTHIPVFAFALLALVLGWGLTMDPKVVPSALIGKPDPKFSLPPIDGRELGLTSTDLAGEVSLVNVFASWCVACRDEHPFLMRLAKDGVVPVHGLNYKDAPDDVSRWLQALGDPYTRTGSDQDGRVAIDWGVYGVPETYVIGSDGRIAHRHIGPLNREALSKTILPLIARLRQPTETIK